MSIQLCAVRSIHILSTSIHSSCEQYKLYTLVHTLLNAGLSCTLHSCSQVLKMINDSNIPLSPDHQSNFIFWCFPKKESLKKRLSLSGGAISLFCVLESAIVLWDGMFELSESEFLMIHSKAKSTVPKQSAALRTEERGGSDLTVLRGTNDGSRIWSRNMAAHKNPFVTQTLKFVTSVASFAPKRHKQAGYLCGISGATHRFPHPSHRQPLRMIHTFLFSSLHFEQAHRAKSLQAWCFFIS